MVNNLIDDQNNVFVVVEKLGGKVRFLCYEDPNHLLHAETAEFYLSPQNIDALASRHFKHMVVEDQAEHQFIYDKLANNQISRDNFLKYFASGSMWLEGEDAKKSTEQLADAITYAKTKGITIHATDKAGIFMSLGLTIRDEFKSLKTDLGKKTYGEILSNLEASHKPEEKLYLEDLKKLNLDKDKPFADQINTVGGFRATISVLKRGLSTPEFQEKLAKNYDYLSKEEFTEHVVNTLSEKEGKALTALDSLRFPDETSLDDEKFKDELAKQLTLERIGQDKKRAEDIAIASNGEPTSVLYGEGHFYTNFGLDKYLQTYGTTAKIGISENMPNELANRFGQKEFYENSSMAFLAPELLASTVIKLQSEKDKPLKATAFELNGAQIGTDISMDTLKNAQTYLDNCRPLNKTDLKVLDSIKPDHQLPGSTNKHIKGKQ